MKRFTDILVGVDLSAGDRFVCDELAPPTEEAIQRALWLATLNSARLLFLYSQDVSAQTQRLIQENQGAEPTVADRAAVVLETLVQRAGQEGIAANRLVVFGKSWVEIIRQVLRRKHDLVIAGTRHLGPVKGFLVGSTGSSYCGSALARSGLPNRSRIGELSRSSWLTALRRWAIWRWSWAVRWPSYTTRNSMCCTRRNTRS